MTSPYRFPIACAIIAGSVSFPVESHAQAPPPAASLAAEQCITYRREGNDAFRLVNSCAEPLSVAICAETSQSGECARNIGWQNFTVAARSDVPGNYLPLQVISVLACKAPATVRMLEGGKGSCGSDGVDALPILLASSLKNASSIITPADYPRGVKAEGTTRFEIVVDGQGRPQGCTIMVSAGNEALDRATCTAFARRARFTPARDATGQPQSGRYRGSVTWKAP